MSTTDHPQLDRALQLLKEGGVVILPTDTIVGLSCDATNEAAAARIMTIKERDPSKSFVILVSDDGMLQRYVRRVPEVAWEVLDAATEPITIIYPEAVGLAKGVAADDGTIAIRIQPPGPVQKLIQRLRRPVVSTSANISGQAPATTAETVSAEVLERVDHVVTSPAASGNKPSSIIKIGLGGEVSIIRS